MANFPGTTGNDTYLGTPDDDVVSDGGGGSDNLNGAGGADQITVTGGVDNVDGGAGDLDLLIAEYGTQTGDFTTVDVGGGVTRLSILNGSTGVSVDYRNIERFNITTGGGADTVITFGGNDTIRSGAGNDTIDSGAGLAVIDGGDGFDEWRANLSLAAGDGVLDLANPAVQAFVGSTISGIEAVRLTLGAGNQRVMTLTGAASANRADSVSGGAGDDTVGVGGGNDTVDGGVGGDDLLIADYRTQTGSFTTADLGGGGTRLSILNGTTGVSVDYVNVERVNFTTGSGADSLAGGAGADTINPGAGDDTVAGGAGVDRLVVDYSASTAAVTTGARTATVGGGFTGVVSNGTTAFSTQYSAIETFDITGGSGADVLTGAAGDDTLRDGPGGNDSLNGAAGGDVIAVSGGVDTVDGGAGDDLLIVDYGRFSGNFNTLSSVAQGFDGFRGDAGAVLDFRNVERFLVTTGSGADSIVTRGGNDTISTGAGNDLIQSEAGDDLIDGGDGDDILRVGVGNDVATGGSGVDRLVVDYAASTAAVTTGVRTASNGGGLTGAVTDGTAAFRVTHTGVETFDVTGGSGNDILTGADGNDRLAGAAGADRLDGGDGDDVLISGTDGRSVTINGPMGLDTVTGGAGVDVLIADFSRESGVVVMGAGFITNGSGSRVDYTGIERFEISGGAGAEVLTGGTLNDTLNGGGGDDTLTGGGGADQLSGGNGADVFVIGVGDSPTTGSDNIFGFETGRDKLDLRPLMLTSASRITFEQNILPATTVRVDADGDGIFETRVDTVFGTITMADVLGLPGAPPPPGTPPSTPDLVAPSDSGASSTDNVTNDNTPTVTGTAPAGATVEILDGTTVVGTGVADSAGVYTVTTSALADGVRALTARSTGAATSSGAETQGNSFTTGAQTAPSAAALSGGGYVVTWTSAGQDGSGGGVYAQRYSSNGQTSGAEFRVNTTTGDSQFEPSVAALGNNRFVVVWESTGQDGAASGVYMQRFTAGGVADGAETRVNTTAAGSQGQPEVAMLLGGAFVVTWTSTNQDGSGEGVYQQRYDAAGTPVGGETRVNTFTAGDQNDTAVVGLAGSAGGGHVVVWVSDGQDGGGAGVYAQRYTGAGAAAGAEFRVNTVVAGAQDDPSVTALADGGFVITWSSLGQDGSSRGIYMQRYDVTGAAIGAETRVNTTTLDDQRSSDVTALTGGGFVVTWHSTGQDGSGAGVYSRQYSAAGVALGGETLVNVFTTGDQHFAAAAALPNGAFLVAWQSEGQDGASSGIYSRIFTSSGGGQSAALNVAIDTAAPGAPSIIRFADDTGMVGDGITADTTPTLVGSAEARSTITVLRDGVVVGSTTTDDQGFWSYTSPALASGVYSFTARATDTAGNQSLVSAPTAITVVTAGGVAPSTPDLVAASDSGASSTDNVTNDNTPTVTGTATAGSTVDILDGTTVVGTGFADANGVYTITTLPLADGVRALTARVAGSTATGETIFQVNQSNPADPGNEQFSSAIARLAGGGFVEVWFNERDFGSQIAGRRYTAAGAADGDQFAVGAASGFRKEAPAVAALSDGGFVVTWTSTPTQFLVGQTFGPVTFEDGSGTGVYAQRYLASGAAAGPQFRVSTTTAGDQSQIVVSELATGGFVVTWTSAGQDGSGLGVYGQRYLASGAADGAEFRVNAVTAGDQSFSSITALVGGGFLVTWQSAGQDGSGFGVYGQRYLATGAADGGEFRINSFTASDQTAPAAAAFADGSFVVVWTSAGQDGSGAGVYGQRFSASGAPVGAEFRVNSFTTNGQSDPAVTTLDDGGFVVTWNSAGQDNAGPGPGGGVEGLQAVYGQRYSASGLPNGAEFLVSAPNGNPAISNARSDVASRPGGGFVVTWTEFNAVSRDSEILSRIFTAAAGGGGQSGVLTVTVDTTAPAAPAITGFSDDTPPVGDGRTADTTPTLSGTAESNAVVTVLRDGVVVGTTAANAAGQWSFTSAELAAGVYSFTARATDLAGNTGAASAPTTITIATSTLNDLIIGGPGPDFLAGGAGDDTLRGAGGNDTLTGGADNDTLEGQEGSDTADYGDSPSGVTVSLALQGSPQNTGFGNDTLFSIENLRGSEFNDRLTGDDGANILLGLGGADTLTGAGGNDQIAGGAGADSIDGGTGADRLFGQDGVDTVAGGEGDDVLFGGADGDSLSGGAGADSLNGEAGNDTLDGGAGLDVLSGEAGADLLNGGDDGDQLYGGADGDQLNGGAGGDVLNGEGGADTLNGGDQDDTLSGEDGADILIGGRGADVLIGGTGADRFAWLDAGESTVNGRDLVFDFTSGSDVLDLSLVDANTLLAGDQAFVLADSFQAGQAGRLVVTQDAATGRVLVVGDTDGDGVGDFGFVVGGLFTGPAGPGVIALSTFAPGDLIL